MVRAVGEGSEIIANSAVGDSSTCWGRWARRFTLDPSARRLAMVGGGYGVAPLVALATEALGRGCEVVLLVGAATADYVFPADELPPESSTASRRSTASLGPSRLRHRVVAALSGLVGRRLRLRPDPDAGSGGAADPAGPFGWPARSAREAGPACDGAAHGLRDGRLPGLRGDDAQGVSAGLPRRPGLPGRRDDLGGRACLSPGLGRRGERDRGAPRLA